MKIEQAIQKRFTNIITKQDELVIPNEALEVYTELVYYRFLEVFEKAYPRFKQMVSDEVFDALIYEFLKVGAKTPILWKVSGEFKTFLIENNNLEMDFLADLLEFEFLEIEMFMQKYEEHQEQGFSLENCYIFSETCNIRTFSYPVHHPEFDASPKSFESGEFIVLFYYDARAEQVLYEEISPFIYEFLQLQNGEKSLMQLINETALSYEIQSDELLEVLSSVLEHFSEKNILLPTH